MYSNSRIISLALTNVLGPGRALCKPHSLPINESTGAKAFSDVSKLKPVIGEFPHTCNMGTWAASSLLPIRPGNSTHALACLPGSPSLIQDSSVPRRQRCKGVWRRSNSAGGIVYGLYTPGCQHPTRHTILLLGLQWDLWGQGHLHQRQSKLAGVQPTQTSPLHKPAQC